jgi:hypothetical protein
MSRGCGGGELKVERDYQPASQAIKGWKGASGLMHLLHYNTNYLVFHVSSFMISDALSLISWSEEALIYIFRTLFPSKGINKQLYVESSDDFLQIQHSQISKSLD